MLRQVKSQLHGDYSRPRLASYPQFSAFGLLLSVLLLSSSSIRSNLSLKEDKLQAAPFQNVSKQSNILVFSLLAFIGVIF